MYGERSDSMLGVVVTGLLFLVLAAILRGCGTENKVVKKNEEIIKGSKKR